MSWFESCPLTSTDLTREFRLSNHSPERSGGSCAFRDDSGGDVTAFLKGRGRVKGLSRNGVLLCRRDEAAPAGAEGPMVMFRREALHTNVSQLVRWRCSVARHSSARYGCMVRLGM